MHQVRTRRRQRLLIRNVDWQEYSRQLRFFEERPGYRLTYDRGMLEIMSPLLAHDNAGYLLGRLVDILTEELNLPIKAGGSTTFRRRKRERGLEPDNCCWIANEAAMRGKLDVDLRTDPPPDLAIEIDVTNSSLDRMGIYRSLRVPEVWRLEGDVLTFNILQPKRGYAVQAQSLAFPKVTPADLLNFLALRGQLDETTIAKQFREWVRQHIAGSPSGGGSPPLTY